jgi:hypothetical protein
MRGNPDAGRTGGALFSGLILLLISGCRSAWLLVVQEGSQD